MASPLLNAVETCRTQILHALLEKWFLHMRVHLFGEGKSTKWSTKSLTEGQQSTKWSTKSVTEGATTQHELEHKKCHGGSDNKARSGAQKVSRREGKKSANWEVCHFDKLIHGALKKSLEGRKCKLQQNHCGNVAGTASITSV